MAEGTMTTDVPLSDTISHVIGNDDVGGVAQTVRQTFTKLSEQLAASGAVASAIESVAEAVDGAAAGLVEMVTWAELNAIAGSRAGQPGQAVGPDAGTHTDPVVGGTVANKGKYAWSVTPPGWRWIAEYQAVTDETISEINDRPGIYALTSVAGTSSAYTATAPSSVTAYVANRFYRFVPHVDCAANPTLNVNSIGAAIIVRSDATNIAKGDLRAGVYYLLERRGASWIVVAEDVTSYSPNNLPSIAKAGVTSLSLSQQMSGARIPFRNITDVLPKTVNEAAPIFIGAMEIGKIVQVTGDRTLDLRSMPAGGFFEVVTDATSSTATIYGGTGANWRGRTAGHRTIVLDADTHATIRKVSGSDFLVTVHRGAIGSSNATAPAARDMTLVVMGESHAQYFGDYGGFQGVQDGFGALSLSKSIWPVNCGFGGAAIMEGFGTTGTNHFWNDAGTPGPNAVTALASIEEAISAGQPAPEDVLFIIGENELNDLTTSTLIDDWKAAAEALIAWFRTELSLPNLRFHWVPLGIDEYSATADTIYSAIREAQLDVIAGDADILQGPEMYYLSRADDDTHLDFKAIYELGRRWAYHVDNAANAASNNLGPEILGVTELTSSSFRIEINSGGTGSLLTLHEWPQLFAFIAAGTPIGQTPKTIRRFSWAFSSGTYKLTAFLTEEATGARLVYPWGRGFDGRVNIIQDASRRPLRAYVG